MNFSKPTAAGGQPCHLACKYLELYAQRLANMGAKQSFKLLNRPCWWCGSKLSAASHAVLPDGRWTHKICERDALASLRPVTAQPADKAIMPFDSDTTGHGR
jgi:hypothetical protein